MALKTYRCLETPKLYANVYAESISDTGVLSEGDLSDPSSSMKIIIEDATGIVVQALADMTKDATGKYSYASYTIPTGANTGVWNYECRATSGTTVATGRGQFRVEEEAK